MSLFSPRARALSGVLVALMLAACSGDPTGPSTQSPYVRVLAGPAAQDTVQATPLQALIVQVTDSLGGPLAGAVVRFRGVARTDSSGGWPYTYATMLVGPVTGAGYGAFVAVNTDQRGQALAMVQFGTHIGSAAVAVEVPAYGAADTVRYTVLPGAAAIVRVAPRDTVLATGASYALSATVADRFGNPLPVAATFGHPSSGVTVSGSQVTTTAAGRQYVVASAGSGVDTAWASVVPLGTIAAFRPGATGRIAIFNLDGSGYRELTPPVGSGDGGEFGWTPAWSPDGSRIVYATGGSGTSALYTMDLDGNTAALITTPVDSFDVAAYPRYSRDGTWIYFSGRVGTGQERNFRLWRVRSDGTGAEPVLPQRALDWRSSPSPDGLRLAFSDAIGAEVLDIATQTVTQISTGQYDRPMWSPVSDTIAYLAFDAYYGSAVHVVAANGTGDHPVSPPWRFYHSRAFDWSPDGRWIIVQGQQYLELVDTRNSTALPLRFTAGLTDPAWKP